MDRLKKLLEIVSLSKKYRDKIFLIVLIILLFTPLSFLESFPNFSVCSRVFGKYCYSVGITRGLSSLLKGNFIIAWGYNPLAYLVLIVMISIILYDSYRKITSSF